MGVTGLDPQVQALFGMDVPFMIAGSYPLWLLCGRPDAWQPSDIDVYTQNVPLLRTKLHKDYKFSGVKGSSKKARWYCPRSGKGLNVNLCETDKGPTATTALFDITLVDCALIQTPLGIELYQSKASREAVEANEIRLSGYVTSSVGKVFERVAKYHLRGFAIGDGVIQQLLDLATKPTKVKPHSTDWKILATLAIA